MRALVVFESMFGNTKEIAEAVGDGLRERADVSVAAVSDAGMPAEDLDLIVVGGPTHAFGMSRPSTREEAQHQSPQPAEVSVAMGIREWIEALPEVAGQQSAVAFDTRVERVRSLPGRASKGAGRDLRRHGYRLLSPAESFYVTDTQGPLLPGELARAYAWGAFLGSVAARRLQESA